MAAPGAQVRPYRDFLTPALHRRFTKASRYTLLLCYIIACWMSEWHALFWIWFPIGPTGARTLLVYLPALLVYLLRVSQWHVGQRQTLTQAETLTKYIVRQSTLQTVVFYAFSAWLYSEVYMWSRPVKDKLGLTVHGRPQDRVKLNERPLYVRFLFFLLALYQSGAHIWQDYDKIEVATMKPRKDKDETATALTRKSPKPRKVLVAEFANMALISSARTTTIAVVGFAFYFAGPRCLIWDYYYSFNKYFVSLSKTSKPTGLAPFLPLCFQFIVHGFFLVLLWEFVNKAFDLYIAQEPLKNDNPITNDSKDPNGSLLNGLKSKKDAVKAIAFWELALITDAFPDRRKTIYTEIDRKKAPTFQQVTDLCLAEVKFLIQRVNEGLNPEHKPIAAAGSSQPAAPVNLVPQIAQPLKNDKNITVPPPNPNTTWEVVKSTTSKLAKSQSTPGNAQQAYGREVITKGHRKAQEGAQQAESFLTLYYNKLVASPLGAVFSQSLARTANLVVLGAPYSRISLICNAVTALANLAVFSLAQDSLGRFHEGVPEIIRVFSTAIAKLDEYMAHVEIHWSDRETPRKPEAERRKVPEVEEVRECLREGLERILGSFNEYLMSMGLSKLEIIDAKKAIITAKGPEMIKVGGKK